jgi:hypothetical protein
LIQNVYQTLDELRIKGTSARLPEPAVPVKRSVTPDYIVSLEDGRWPAPGSADTELGVLMEREVGHGETDVYAGVQA